MTKPANVAPPFAHYARQAHYHRFCARVLVSLYSADKFCHRFSNVWGILSLIQAYHNNRNKRASVELISRAFGCYCRISLHYNIPTMPDFAQHLCLHMFALVPRPSSPVLVPPQSPFESLSVVEISQHTHKDNHLSSPRCHYTFLRFVTQIAK